MSVCEVVSPVMNWLFVQSVGCICPLLLCRAEHCSVFIAELFYLHLTFYPVKL